MLKLTPENCAIIAPRERWNDPNVPRCLVRILSEGFGALVDGDIEKLIGEHCTITATRESESAFTMAGRMAELTYTTPDGRTLHAYTIVSVNIDSWCEEWIVSAETLAWHDAADLIQQARKLAYPYTYGTETKEFSEL